MKKKDLFESPCSFLVSVDCVVFGVDDDVLKVLLVRRQIEPFKNCWILPSGFLKQEESFEERARKNLEEIGPKKLFLEQLFTYSNCNSDTDLVTITVAYYALVKMSDFRLKASVENGSVQWWPVSSVPELAFDHKRILKNAVDRLRGKVIYQPIGFELLPSKFTLSQLQRLYEIILERNLDKRNFRRKILAMGLLRPLREREKDVPRRAALLHSFDERRYKELERQGFNFEI